MKQEKSLESPQEQKWGIRHVVYGLLLGQVSTILAIVAIGLIDQDIDLEDPSLEITAILQSALWIGTLGIPLWLYYSKGVSWRQFGWRFKRSDIFKGLLIGLGTQIAAGLLYLPLYVIFDDIDVSEPAKELVDKATGLGVFLLFLVVVVGAPVVEEIFYRGLTLKAFEKKMGGRLALVASSLLFAVAHLQFVQFPALFLFGFVAAYLARKYDRLGRAVWAHVGFNATTVIALLLQG
ncbi:MAG: type II CAAX endopeptidase family protein [Actinomycetota bacterium]|nr:type II CAAX endopeptidase family protein [Actinomycetota bacterium]|tara:strand:+ start:371 stop:1078 length:708 start_codon:yes stop_codon:yes gene_type:complete